METFNKPSGFLQMIFHAGIVLAVIRSFYHAGVKRIDAQFRRYIGIQVDLPFFVLLGHVDIGDNIFGIRILYLRTRLGIQRSDECHHLIQLPLCHTQFTYEF